MDHTLTSPCSYMGKIATEPAKEKHQLPLGCKMSVRLRKDQNDKASKATSGRTEEFSKKVQVII